MSCGASSSRGDSPASRLRIAADVHRNSTSDDDSGCVLEEYAWVPSGLKPDMVHAYFACLPADKVPYINSEGERWRLRQLSIQLPPQDSDPRYCEGLSAAEEEELWRFEETRKRECLGRGVVLRLPFDSRLRRCSKCSERLDEGAVAVEAEQAGSRQLFHPACFRCTACECLLVDLLFFHHHQRLFCGRHHAELLKPRCRKCDQELSTESEETSLQLILGEECTEAEGECWHVHHFVCTGCDSRLGGKRYLMRSGDAFCLSCFHATQSPLSPSTSLQCESCSLSIPPSLPHLTQGESHWHATAHCFSCSLCGRVLLGRDFTVHAHTLFCTPRGSCIEPAAGMKRARPHEGRRRQLKETKNRPSPPPRAPPPPPPQTENIYETLLPCSSSSSLDVDKNESRRRRPPTNEYSKSPHGSEQFVPQDNSSSSSSDDDDEVFYLNNLLAAASLARNVPRTGLPLNHVRLARRKRWRNRCVVS